MIRRASITSLTPSEIEALAEDVAREARQLRVLAAERRELDAIARAAQDAVERLRGIPGMVLACLSAGHPYSAARDSLARSLAVPAETIDHHWKGHLKAEQERARIERGYRIVQLAANGLSNAEIARRVGLAHKNSVTRILRQVIAARRARPGTTPPPGSPPPATTTPATAATDRNFPPPSAC